MSVTLGVVEVPALASRHGAGFTPASRRFGGKPLVEWVVRRVTESLLVEKVVILVDAKHYEYVLPLVPADVSIFAGEQADALARLSALIRQEDAASVVRVSACRPFIDPELIDRLICDANAHPGADYIGYVSDAGEALRARLGVFGDWCRADAVLKADRFAVGDERNDVCSFMLARPEEFSLRLIPVPERLNRADIRLSIEQEEDWEHAYMIYDALGPERLDWRRIADLLLNHPDLRQRMARLNQSELESLAEDSLRR